MLECKTSFRPPSDRPIGLKVCVTGLLCLADRNRRDSASGVCPSAHRRSAVFASTNPRGTMQRFRVACEGDGQSARVRDVSALGRHPVSAESLHQFCPFVSLAKEAGADQPEISTPAGSGSCSVWRARLSDVDRCHVAESPMPEVALNGTSIPSWLAGRG